MDTHPNITAALQATQDQGINKRAPIKRIGKACEACRRAKTRCLNADENPCVRCVASGIECIYSSGMRRATTIAGSDADGDNENRFMALESKMEDISKMLYTLVGQRLPPSSSAAVTSPSSLLLNLASSPTTAPLPSFSQLSPSARNLENPNLSPFQPFLQSPSTHLRPNLDEQPRKRPRTESVLSGMPSPAPWHLSPSPPVVGSGESTPATFEDFVTRRILSEQLARSLFAVYMTHCAEFVPILDRNHSYERTKQAMPLTFNVIMAVGCHHMDKPVPDDRIIATCLREVEGMVKATLLMNPPLEETPQALAILAAWHVESSFLLTGHALRTAVDLRMNKALAKLHDVVSLSDLRFRDPVLERRLVHHSRVWLYIVWLDWEMSLGNGRTLPIFDDKNTQNQLLTLLHHQASISSDVKLICNRLLMDIERGTTSSILSFDGSLCAAHFAFAQSKLREMEDWYHFSCARCEEVGEPNHCRWVARQLGSSKVLLLSRILSRRREQNDGLQQQVDNYSRLAIQCCHESVEHIFAGPLGRSQGGEMHKFGYATNPIYVEIAFAALFVLRMLQVSPSQDIGTLQTILTNIMHMETTLAASKLAIRYSITLRIALDRFRRSLNIPAPPQNAQLEAEFDAILTQPPFSLEQLELDFAGIKQAAPPHLVCDPVPAWIADGSMSQVETNLFGSGLEDMFLPSWTVDDFWKSRGNSPAPQTEWPRQ